MSIMGLPRQLTEKQMKFAELLVYNEGRKSASECAYEAGYKTRPRQAASELRNPRISPLVVQYIGELRREIQEKYQVDLGRHLGELAKLRDDAMKKGAWSAAINAEVARGKAGGLYVDQKLILSGNLDNMSEKELEAKMAKILDDHKNLIDVSPEESQPKSKTEQIPVSVYRTRVFLPKRLLVVLRLFLLVPYFTTCESGPFTGGIEFHFTNGIFFVKVLFFIIP